MKKRQTVSKSIKHKSTHSIPKKTSKSKHKPKNNKEQSQCYVLVGDQFYLASTKTERNTCTMYEQRVKTRSTKQSDHPMASTHESSQNINPRQYVSTLTKEEKKQLLQQLQKQLDIEKEQSQHSEKNAQAQLEQLHRKIQYIKIELGQEAEQQMNAINHLFENEQISLEDKNQKIRLIETIINNKIHMLDCANNLFNRILHEDTHDNKEQQLQQIINSINSLPSLHQLQNSPRVVNSIADPIHFENDLPLIVSKLSPQHNEEQEEQSFEKELSKVVEQKEKKHIKPSQTPEAQIFTRQSLHLDIRLDQVQFGRDHYDNQEKQEQQNKVYQQEISDKNENVYKKQQKQVDSKGGNGPTITPVENQNNYAFEQKKLEEQFLAVEEQPSGGNLNIPLLMTKDRKQQLQYQKSSKQVQTLTLMLKSRHSFQVSQIPPENDNHFTTLLDVNNFVVSFYEFIIQRFMRQIIQGLNLAFGKSAVDKIFQIRSQGFVDDYDNHSIVPDELLTKYHNEVMLSGRRIPQYEKIHNRAVFTTFRQGLNVYRPYFELQGEVFPWNTSEKGLTFYEINDQNIQEVFEKSKMKVLEFCASLCGIMANCQITTQEPAKILKKRNEDSYERVLKGEITEKFGEWYLKMLNFQALVRLNLSEQIWQQELQLALSEIENIHK